MEVKNYELHICMLIYFNPQCDGATKDYIKYIVRAELSIYVERTYI